MSPFRTRFILLLLASLLLCGLAAEGAQRPGVLHPFREERRGVYLSTFLRFMPEQGRELEALRRLFGFTHLDLVPLPAPEAAALRVAKIEPNLPRGRGISTHLLEPLGATSKGILSTVLLRYGNREPLFIVLEVSELSGLAADPAWNDLLQQADLVLLVRDDGDGARIRSTFSGTPRDASPEGYLLAGPNGHSIYAVRADVLPTGPLPSVFRSSWPPSGTRHGP